MRTLRLAIVTCLAVAGPACGQKGPLLLPDAQHPHKKITLGKPPAAPAPAAPAPAPAAPAPAPSASAAPDGAGSMNSSITPPPNPQQ